MRTKLNYFLFKDWNKGEQVPAFLARVLVGVFFAISGFAKLFDHARHMSIYDTLVQANIPLPEFNSYFVPIIELVFGLFLVFGFLTLISGLILLFNMLVATLTVAIHGIKASNFFYWLNDFLYLPEVLLMLLLFWIIFAGAGSWSLDRCFARRDEGQDS